MSRKARLGTSMTLGITLAALTACVADPTESKHVGDDTDKIKIAAEVDDSSSVLPAPVVNVQAPKELGKANLDGHLEAKNQGKKDEAQRRQQIADLITSQTMTNGNAVGMQHIVPAADAQAFQLPSVMPHPEMVDRENYAHVEESSIKLTATDPVSTFSIDVDTGAYANVRRFLNKRTLPPQDAVRIEEMINYFNYSYPTPNSEDTPFSVTTEMATTPWNADTLLLQVGLKGYEIHNDERPASNLVFLLDVSGSMNSANKLPLLKRSFDLLTKQLNADDRISIVVYAGASGVVLEPTPGNERATIMDALNRLRAGGSTNGAAGINLAYQMAEEAFVEDGINRIILATDGDFNVGTTNFDSLIDLAERKRKSGVSLTTLGFGGGNYNDHLMEQLADAGNGNYAYIDTLDEAKKVLVQEMSSTLFTIAKDVKIQIEFNPNVIAHYRLIGYENRALRNEDFNNDAVDAGEIGAGHTVTALYELTPVDSATKLVDPLRYSSSQQNNHRPENPRSAESFNNEVAFLKLRYKQPQAERSTKISYPITPT